MTRRFTLAMLRMLAIAALAMGTFAMPAYAQDDDDDTGGDDVVTDVTEFSAYIYEGTVDDFGERPVDDVGALELLSEDDDDPDDEAREIWRAISSDDETMPAVLYGDDADADLTLEELTSEPHVLVVHAGEEADEPVIAAGAIEVDTGNGTAVPSDGVLIIDLEEVDDSGYEGRAYFGQDDEGEDPDRDENDDDEVDDQESGDTDVIVGLWQLSTEGV